MATRPRCSALTRRRDADRAARALYQTQTGRAGGDRKVVAGGRTAAWKLERGDTSLPVECAITGKVFVRVPGRAIVAWVDGHRTVIAPTRLIAAGRRSRAVGNRPFSLGHEPLW